MLVRTSIHLVWLLGLACQSLAYAAQQFPARGECRASGRLAAIDDMEDGDSRPLENEGRLGLWYSFNAGGSCQQTPASDDLRRFTMSLDRSNRVAATRGSQCRGNGWTGGGIGVSFLSADSGPGQGTTPCAEGYDASAYQGLSFSMKSLEAVRLQVCTANVKDGNCYGLNLPATQGSWREVSLPWLLLQQEDWGQDSRRVPFDARQITAIQFRATSEQFTFAIDDLSFFAAASADPLPQGRWSGYRPEGLYAEQIRSEYASWKSSHLAVCMDGSADVRKENNEGVSEGTGYGMLIAASLDDRVTFERLFAGYQKRKNQRGMMNWRFALCGSSWGEGAATDADLDIAMALVIADRKWGSYRGAAEALITSIKRYASAQCSGYLVLRPGDTWGGCNDASDQRLNPSYFSPAYYRVFAAFVPAQADFWQALANDSYRLLERYQQAMGGLLPDWAYADGRLAGSYGYEACRVPWRIAMDYAWHGREEAARLLSRMAELVEARGGPGALSDQANSCFIGGLALTAGVVSQERSDAWYRSWMRSVPQGPDPSVGDNPYYQGTLRILYLLVARSDLRP